MDDIISRQAAIDAIEAYFGDLPIVVHYDMLQLIKKLPSAERRGRWENIEHAPNGLLYATCSVCGKRQTVEAVNYCGNCGARMEASE